jgi:hypothetical protein
LRRNLAAHILDGMWATNNPLTAELLHAARRRPMRRMVATIALTLLAPSFVPRLAAPAYAQPPVLTAWLAANAECKGGHADDPKTAKACEQREQIGARLKRRGCVYQEAGDWWKCPHR